MHIRIFRDSDGRVTITDLATGRTETLSTGTAARPAEAKLGPAEPLPSHMWSRLAA